jgi:hypothetical protein
MTGAAVLVAEDEDDADAVELVVECLVCRHATVWRVGVDPFPDCGCGDAEHDS